MKEALEEIKLSKNAEKKEDIFTVRINGTFINYIDMMTKNEAEYITNNSAAQRVTPKGSRPYSVSKNTPDDSAQHLRHGTMRRLLLSQQKIAQ